MPILCPPSRCELGLVTSLMRTLQWFPVALRILSRCFPGLLNLHTWPLPVFPSYFLSLLPLTLYLDTIVSFLVSAGHQAWLNPWDLGKLFLDFSPYSWVVELIVPLTTILWILFVYLFVFLASLSHWIGAVVHSWNTVDAQWRNK